MARKGRNRSNTPASQIEWGTSLQDRRPLASKIAAIAGAVVDDAIAEPIEELEGISEAIETGVPVRSADVELAGGYAGEVVIEGTWTERQVGAPVIVTQSGDVEELALIVFAGRVVDTRRIRVRYISSSPAPRRTRVNFIIGVRA
jgi:hypothetical protein